VCALTFPGWRTLIARGRPRKKPKPWWRDRFAYFGTYSINEVDKILTAKVEGSTYANLIGTDQKRIITSLTADELKFTNPRTPAGVTLEFVWKRAK